MVTHVPPTPWADRRRSIVVSGGYWFACPIVSQWLIWNTIEVPSGEHAGSSSTVVVEVIVESACRPRRSQILTPNEEWNLPGDEG